MKLLEKLISYLEWLMLGVKDEGEKVALVLKNLDRSSLEKRERNRWDDEFIKLVPSLHLYSEALDLLNRYGWVCNTYFDELSKYEPDRNLFLQRCFCRVTRNRYTDRLVCKYPNLIFHYLMRWDLSKETKCKLREAPGYYEDVIDLYNKFAPELRRECI